MRMENEEGKKTQKVKYKPQKKKEKQRIMGMWVCPAEGPDH